MQRRALANRWQSEVWEPWGVLAGGPQEGPPRLIVDEAGVQQWLHPGFRLTLYRDEAEGYYLNVSSGSPPVRRIFFTPRPTNIPARRAISSNVRIASCGRNL